MNIIERFIEAGVSVENIKVGDIVTVVGFTKDSFWKDEGVNIGDKLIVDYVRNKKCNNDLASLRSKCPRGLCTTSDTMMTLITPFISGTTLQRQYTGCYLILEDNMGRRIK